MIPQRPLDPQARFVLTGPSGWIGQAYLAHIAGRFGAGRLGDAGGHVPLASKVTAFAATAREMVLPWGERLQIRALNSIRPDDVEGAHVVHLAYLTKEKADQLGERQFMDTNLDIDDRLLSAIQDGKPSSMFVASSGAAKLAAEGTDLHPYGVAKLRQEARFLGWGHAADVPVIAGRIFNIAGPYINKINSYAISNMVQQAMMSRAITIAAAVPVYRSFLHVDDLCGLMVNAATDGIGRETPIDLCGAEVVEMEDLAIAIMQAVGGEIQINRGAVDFTRPSAYVGDFPQTKTLAMQTGMTLKRLTSCIDDTMAWMSRSSAAVALSDSHSDERDIKTEVAVRETI